VDRGAGAVPRLADDLSIISANGYRECMPASDGMPADDTSRDGQFHDLYAQADAARKRAQALAGQLHATQRTVRENWQLIRDSWGRAEMILADRRAARSDRDRLRYSAYARLQARLASMPVIEQAKGIIMARQGWSEDQAFEALRRASQRENVKVRDLAATIVARAARPAPGQRPSGPVSATARSGDERGPRAGSGNSRDSYQATA
jgi:hypothetical protein